MFKTLNHEGHGRILLLIFILVIWLGLTFNHNVYADNNEPSSWAREEIEAAKELHAVTDALSEGYKDSLSRAEFVELLVKTYESVTDEVIDVGTVKNPFKDTDKVYLLKAYATGIVNGTSATTFSPDALVTREQMVVMMVRMVEEIEDQINTRLLAPKSGTMAFSDNTQIAEWAYDEVDKAVTNGIISGEASNRFNPAGNSTKEQALLVNYRLLLKLTANEKVITPWQENLVSYESNVEAVLNKTLGKYETSQTKAFVTADILNMRSTPDLSDASNIIRKLKAYEEVVILATEGDWYQIAASGEMIGYVHSDYIHPYSPDSDLNDIRMQIVAYAKQYIGTPYKYGSDNLTTGTDCSGFTSQVMRPFGYVLSRSSTGQGSNGTPITEGELEPGDLITYGYNGHITHVALYIGNGEIIHATTSRGVMISDFRGYLNEPIIGFRRVVF